jgi:hypothetical protein
MPVLHVRLRRLSNHASHLGLQHCSKPSISDRAQQFVECDRVQLTRAAVTDWQLCTENTMARAVAPGAALHQPPQWGESSTAGPLESPDDTSADDTMATAR